MELGLVCAPYIGAITGSAEDRLLEALRFAWCRCEVPLLEYKPSGPSKPSIGWFDLIPVRFASVGVRCLYNVRVVPPTGWTKEDLLAVNLEMARRLLAGYEKFGCWNPYEYVRIQLDNEPQPGGNWPDSFCDALAFQAAEIAKADPKLVLVGPALGSWHQPYTKLADQLGATLAAIATNTGKRQVLRALDFCAFASQNVYRNLQGVAGSSAYQYACEIASIYKRSRNAWGTPLIVSEVGGSPRMCNLPVTFSKRDQGQFWALSLRALAAAECPGAFLFRSTTESGTTDYQYDRSQGLANLDGVWNGAVLPFLALQGVQTPRQKIVDNPAGGTAIWQAGSDP